MTSPRPLSRRAALAAGAAAAALPLVHIRTAAAAGKLTIAFWDHWVPGANDVMTKLVNEWSAKTKTECTIDFVTSVGNKNLLTIAAEAQAKTGHDINAFPTWEVHNNAQLLEPMDDVVKRLSAKYGEMSPIVEYLSKIDGSYRAMPSISGSQNKPPCARIPGRATCASCATPSSAPPCFAKMASSGWSTSASPIGPSGPAAPDVGPTTGPTCAPRSGLSSGRGSSGPSSRPEATSEWRRERSASRAAHCCGAWSSSVSRGSAGVDRRCRRRWLRPCPRNPAVSPRRTSRPARTPLPLSAPACPGHRPSRP